MRIRGTQNTEVWITDSQVEEMGIDYICKICGIYKNDYIKDGRLMREVEYHGSHSYWETENVCKATKLQINGVELLKAIKNSKKKVTDR